MRDDFTVSVKRTLAQRAAYFCSNPSCLKLTAGPHSEIGKSLLSGHAAHIHAASPKGPRFDPYQSPEQRSDIANAIWLCRECGDIVDKDTPGYSADTLVRWKHDHEAMLHEIRQKGYSQSLSLLQSRQQEPQIAKAILDILQDRRAFWENFDIERPPHVLQSLDSTRGQLTRLKSQLPSGSAMDLFIDTMTTTIRQFFQRMAAVDLAVLRCDSRDPDWIAFKDALYALRKAIGLQLYHLINAYSLPVSDEIGLILPR